MRNPHVNRHLICVLLLESEQRRDQVVVVNVASFSAGCDQPSELKKWCAGAGNGWNS